jgi:hypothetical protein
LKIHTDVISTGAVKTRTVPSWNSIENSYRFNIHRESKNEDSSIMELSRKFIQV